MGKALGAQRIIDWLKEKQEEVDTYYTFGDSQTDIEMAKKLYAAFGKSKQITFVFVGEKMPWSKNEFPFAIHHVIRFDKGTMQFLEEIKN